MVTLFSNPRPFVDIFDRIQRNAIESWLELIPTCEIILFDDEKGSTAEVAKEYGIKCITEVECNEYGTPLLRGVFKTIQQIAKNDILAYVNTDIILMNDFLRAIEQIRKSLIKKSFYMVGRRVDLNLNKRIDYCNSLWEQNLRKKVDKEGTLHGFSGMDYWVFPKTVNFDIPPFAKGRTTYDTWLVYRAKMLRIPVIDSTEMVMAVHQNHYYPQKKSKAYVLEKQKNIKLAGGLTCLMTLRNADWILVKNGIVRPIFLRRLFSQLSMFYPWRLFLALKRFINMRLRKI